MEAKKRWLVPLLVVLGLVVFASAGFLRFFVYVPYRHPSGSMWPTIPSGARVSANGLDSVPKRGAVVVFRYPEHREQLFMKRVLALGGDVVEFKAGRPSVNGWEVPRCDVGKAGYDDSEGQSSHHEGELFVEFLGDDAYLVFEDRDGLLSDFGRWEVSPGEMFLLGDNRRNSHDSRMWFGGRGGGAPVTDSLGRVRTPSPLSLPKGAEGLRGALDACLAKRPAQTSPPSK
jgi:signal peptidase I